MYTFFSPWRVARGILSRMGHMSSPVKRPPTPSCHLPFWFPRHQRSCVQPGRRGAQARGSWGRRALIVTEGRAPPQPRALGEPQAEGQCRGAHGKKGLGSKSQLERRRPGGPLPGQSQLTKPSGVEEIPSRDEPPTLRGGRDPFPWWATNCCESRNWRGRRGTWGVVGTELKGWLWESEGAPWTLLFRWGKGATPDVAFDLWDKLQFISLVCSWCLRI